MQSEQLRAAWDAIREAGAEQLPELIGQLEAIKATAWARLNTPAQQQEEKLIEIDEAATRLGVSKDYLYRNHSKFHFTRRMGRKLLFSTNGIDRHIRDKKRA